MRLQDFDKKYFSVLKDGRFDTLGFCRKECPPFSLGYVQTEKYIGTACNNENISCVICPESLAGNELLRESGKGIAVCCSPQVSFILLHNDLAQNNTSYVAKYDSTRIGQGCQIHPTAVIASNGVDIGDNVIIEEYAVVREGCQIGNNVCIRAGAYIGIDNDNLCWDDSGKIVKMRETGRICLADNVEVGFRAMLARGTFPYHTTFVGERTCIDSDVLVAHNCHIEQDCFVAAKSQICGSVQVGARVRVNPMAIIKDSLVIGNDAVISMGSVVARNVQAGSQVTGNFAVEHSKFLADYLKKLRN